MRILTQVANSYVLAAAAREFTNFYKTVFEDEVEHNDFSNLPALHSELAVHKVGSSKLMHEGNEIVRQACGGHGFSIYCGIGTNVQEMSPAVTYEGENMMIIQ
jgi:acyl-CoA oxidase